MKESNTGKVVVTNFNLPTLMISPFQMQPASYYTLFLNVGYIDALSSSISYQVNITSGPESLFASAGASYTIRKNGDLVLSASIIDQSYAIPLNESLFSCNWSCADSLNLKPCVSQVSRKQLSFNNRQCSDQNLTGLLSSGLTYVFGVNVTNTATGSMVIGDDSFVTISNSLSVIRVGIDTSDLNPGSSSSGFFLKALTIPDGNDGGDGASYSWTSAKSCNGKQFSHIDINPGTTSLTSPFDQYLRLIPGALIPGASYCFVVDVSDGNGNNGTASIAIKVRDAPNGGACSVLGANSGSPLSTLFSFQCFGWVTEARSYPLSYSFNIRSIGSKDWAALATASSKSIYSTVLMAGAYEIQAQVIDSAGSINALPQIMR